jgi:transcriptional regulator with XRE-family HTH domain
MQFSKHYLKEWRIYREYTQAHLADMICKNVYMVWRYENGMSGLNQPTLDALAIALDTTRANILDFPPPKA